MLRARNLIRLIAAPPAVLLHPFVGVKVKVRRVADIGLLNLNLYTLVAKVTG